MDGNQAMMNDPMPPPQVPCERVVPFVQTGPTCWFNSLLTSILFSEGGRSLALAHRARWDLPPELAELFQRVLAARRASEARDDARAVCLPNVLRQLHRWNPSNFFFDPDRAQGFFADVYGKPLYHALGVGSVAEMVAWDMGDYYGIFHGPVFASKLVVMDEERGRYKHASDMLLRPRSRVPPPAETDVLLVTVLPRKGVPYYGARPYDVFPKSFLQAPMQVIDETRFVVDSVFLQSIDEAADGQSHQLAGVTCGARRYLYDGNVVPRPGSAGTPRPCPLIPFDWLAPDVDFAMDLKACRTVPHTYAADPSLRFSTTGNVERVYTLINAKYFTQLPE